MMAQQGKKVLLIGCDPKSDTTSLLFGGRACPTIIETSSKKKLAGEAVQIGDVCFKRDGVYAMELGGPEVGRGCGGRGIIHGFELLEKARLPRLGLRLRAARLPGRRRVRRLRAADRARHVPEGDRRRQQRPPVALCRQQRVFGGRVFPQSSAATSASPAWSSTATTAPGEAKAFAEEVGIPVLSVIPSNEDIRRKSASYEIIGRPESQWGPMFAELAENVGTSLPVRPKPMTQDALLGLFSAASVGRDVVLEPATLFDMCGKEGNRQGDARSRLRRSLSEPSRS